MLTPVAVYVVCLACLDCYTKIGEFINISVYLANFKFLLCVQRLKAKKQ